MCRKLLIASILMASSIIVCAAVTKRRDSILYQLGRIDQQIDYLNAQKTDLLNQLKEIDEPSTSGLKTIMVNPKKK